MHDTPLPNMPPRAVLLRIRPIVGGRCYRLSVWPELHEEEVSWADQILTWPSTPTAEQLADVLGALGEDLVKMWGRAPARLP